ncbi:leucine-rich_repeat-containing protein [Hexamita inflata]|uniref:Leucine-rich repeat-containing protein n=1 Tax=Hexamita inflata TaxID=28002 RepID=A0AA86TG39_9EUKA|nr:leucine-rich repeat-containing protein [Hexamita inflata]
MNEYDKSMIEKYRGKIQNKSLEVACDKNLKSIRFLQVLDVLTLNLHSCYGLEFKYVPTNITNLITYDCQMQTLMGIQQMKQLEALTVNEIDIYDYHLIQDLVKLKKLHLRGRGICDLKFLKSLVNLQNVAFTSKTIKDFSALSNLNNLIELSLNETQIKNLTPLKQLKGLEHLELWNNGIEEISIIQYLTNLTYLQLGSNFIVDIQPLSRLTYLKSLYLSNNLILQVTALQNLIDLYNFDLEYNFITDFNPIQNIKNSPQYCNQKPTQKQLRLQKALNSIYSTSEDANTLGKQGAMIHAKYDKITQDTHFTIKHAVTNFNKFADQIQHLFARENKYYEQLLQ